MTCIDAISRALVECSQKDNDLFKGVFIGIDYPGYGSGKWKWLNASRLNKIANEAVDYSKLQWRISRQYYNG